MKQSKKELRKIFIAKQSALSDLARIELSEMIAENFFSHFNFRLIQTLHLFLSIDELNEIDTSIFISRFNSDFPNIELVAPRVDFKRDYLVHLKLDSSSQFEKNRWGITEPIGDQFIDEKAIDMVLVPMVCFDMAGDRVGHGKGFYDKFLVKCRRDCIKIGLSFFPPTQRIFDVDIHDVSLNHCVTPWEIFDFSNQ